MEGRRYWSACRGGIGSSAACLMSLDEGYEVAGGHIGPQRGLQDYWGDWDGGIDTI